MATKTVAEQKKAALHAERADVVPFTNRYVPRELLRRMKVAAAMTDVSVSILSVRALQIGMDVVDAEIAEREAAAAAKRKAKAERDAKTRDAKAAKAEGEGNAKKKSAPVLDGVKADDSDGADEAAEAANA